MLGCYLLEAYSFLLKRGVDLEGKRGGGNEEETIIWIYCMRKECIFINGEKVVQELKISHAEKAQMSWKYMYTIQITTIKQKKKQLFCFELSSINFMEQTRHVLIGFRVHSDESLPDTHKIASLDSSASLIVPFVYILTQPVLIWWRRNYMSI